MNKFLVGLILLACFSSFVQAEEPEGLRRSHDLDTALQQGGLAGLVATVQLHHRQAPRVPSKWSVEHRDATPDQREIDLAGREFGWKLALQLDAVAPSLQELPPGDELSRQAHLLCDLSDWCASTDGYGNLFLAQRCLDLAAVGLARLAASLDFPLAECEKLAMRMSPAWMSVEARALTLNDEAGTNLFKVGGTQAEMDATWGSGGFLMREKRSGIIRPEGQGPGQGVIETPALKANLDFFEDDENPCTEPLTLIRSWNSKRYERIVNGLELQNVSKALALLKYRAIVGRFPEKPEFTEDQLRKHEQAVAEAAKYGLKVSRMDEGRPSGKVAFEQAWDQRPAGVSESHALYATAWLAYDEIKTGQFLDQDARASRIVTPADAHDLNAR